MTKLSVFQTYVLLYLNNFIVVKTKKTKKELGVSLRPKNNRELLTTLT